MECRTRAEASGCKRKQQLQELRSAAAATSAHAQQPATATLALDALFIFRAFAASNQSEIQLCSTTADPCHIHALLTRANAAEPPSISAAP